MHNPIYEVTSLPGKDENVSGSLAGGYNLAVNRYSNIIKKKAAVEVLKFITSKEIQKKYIISNNIYSGINSLYDEEDVCTIINCEIVKSVQPFSVIDFDKKHYELDSYIEKYKNYVYDYLNKNKTISEVLKEIDDLTKVYIFSIQTNDTYAGLVIFTIYCITTLTMIILILFLYNKKFHYQFRHLSNIFWILSILGSLIILSSVLTVFGHITIWKCKLRVLLIINGFIQSFLPILYMLIINFPEENIISRWVSVNKYIFYLIFISISTIVTNIFLLPSTYEITNVSQRDGENFQKCKPINILSYIDIFFFIIFSLVVLLLLFMEWNMIEMYYDTRFLLAAILMDFLSLIIYYTIYHIQFNNYILYNSLISIILIIFSISNYSFTYGIKIVLKIIQKKKNDDFDEDEFIKKNQEFNEHLSTTVTQSNIFSKNSSGNSKNGNTHSIHSKNSSSIFSNKIMKCHFKISK